MKHRSTWSIGDRFFISNPALFFIVFFKKDMATFPTHFGSFVYFLANSSEFSSQEVVKHYLRSLKSSIISIAAADSNCYFTIIYLKTSLLVLLSHKSCFILSFLLYFRKLESIFYNQYIIFSSTLKYELDDLTLNKKVHHCLVFFSF